MIVRKLHVFRGRRLSSSALFLRISAVQSHNCRMLANIYYDIFTFTRSPSLGACNYPIFLSRRFTDRSIFTLNIVSGIQIPTGTSVDQLQSQARTKVYMST